MDNVVISISANEKFQVTEHSTFERNDFSTDKGLGCDIEEGGEEGGRVPLLIYIRLNNDQYYYSKDTSAMQDQRRILDQ